MLKLATAFVMAIGLSTATAAPPAPLQLPDPLPAGCDWQFTAPTHPNELPNWTTWFPEIPACDCGGDPLAEGCCDLAVQTYRDTVDAAIRSFVTKMCDCADEPDCVTRAFCEHNAEIELWISIVYAWVDFYTEVNDVCSVLGCSVDIGSMAMEPHGYSRNCAQHLQRTLSLASEYMQSQEWLSLQWLIGSDCHVQFPECVCDAMDSYSDQIFKCYTTMLSELCDCFWDATFATRQKCYTSVDNDFKECLNDARDQFEADLEACGCGGIVQP